MGMVWHGKRCMGKLNVGLERNMERACVFLTGDIKKKFPGSGKAGATKKERMAHPSKPGEIPHVQLGVLKNSIDYQVLKRTAFRGPRGRVGVIKACQGKNKDVAEALQYAAFLEVGTSRMKKRPFLRPGLDRNKAKLARLLGARIR